VFTLKRVILDKWSGKFLSKVFCSLQLNGYGRRASSTTDLEQVRDRHVRMSLELQQVFGLRREEAIKFQPGFADQGDHIVLKASWTKGGKAREIPVRTDEQRSALNRARQLAGNGSLIPSSRNYRQLLRIYGRHTANCRTRPCWLRS